MFNYVCSITYRMTERVCVIGAGPSGMCFMYHLDQMKRQGLEVPDVVCYEKQADWGGVWNYDWRTGNQCDHNGQFFGVWATFYSLRIDFWPKLSTV